MVKAKWISTTYGKGYNAGWITREYEYRGRRYFTSENQKRGNAMGEELWQQHKQEQARIDRELDTPEKIPTLEEIREIDKRQKEMWDEIWKMFDEAE